jgi:transposase
LRNDRIDAPCLFDGPINSERFHAYVEQFLVPTLKPGDVVILDNLGSHKGKAATNDPQCRSPPRLPAEILARPQSDRAGLRQVQNSAAKGWGAKL